MCKIKIKDNGLTISKKTATIKLEWDSENNIAPEKELKALAVMLGAFNKYGRKMDLDKYNEIVEKFEELWNETVEKI